MDLRIGDHMKSLRYLLSVSVFCLWANYSIAEPVYCKKMGSSKLEMHDGRCPADMHRADGGRGIIGRLQNGQANGAYARAHANSRNQPMSPIAESFVNSVNGLTGQASAASAATSTQKKVETIKLIDQLYQSGSISKQQADKLKAEAINN